jgi:hypothetical protein
VAQLKHGSTAGGLHSGKLVGIASRAGGQRWSPKSWRPGRRSGGVAVGGVGNSVRRLARTGVENMSLQHRDGVLPPMPQLWRHTFFYFAGRN